jgi:hypothetical protein
MVTAGTAITMAGGAWSGIVSNMLANDDRRHALALGLSIDALVFTVVGTSIAAAGAVRMRNPDAWLARGDGRRARLARAAGTFDPHTPTTDAERDVVARGKRLRIAGALMLGSGVGLVALGAGLRLAYPSDKLAVKIALPLVPLPFIIAGASLLAAGGRRIYSPQRFVDRQAYASKRSRVQVTAAPSVRRDGLGMTISGRF